MYSCSESSYKVYLASNNTFGLIEKCVIIPKLHTFSLSKCILLVGRITYTTQQQAVWLDILRDSHIIS